MIDKKQIRVFLKFCLVGVFNTILGLCLVGIFYELLHMGYWLSTLLSNVLGGIIAFTLNRNYTFKSDANYLMAGIKFFANVLICYFIAYSMAKPLVNKLVQNFVMILSTHWKDRISILFAMCLFTMLNFLGQRFFVFKT